MELTWENIREAGNSGMFYPATSVEIERFISVFNKELHEIKGKEFLNIKPRAIISPHAGYVYSGFTANAAHKTLANAKPECIVVIGPSHYVYFRGVSAAFVNYYETPFGNLEVDKVFLEKLHKRFGFQFNKTAHYKEHSTETQMPFIAYYNPQAKIIELVYGDTGENLIAAIIKEVLKNKECAVVISSDLSHFHTLTTAERLDGICIKAFENKNMDLYGAGCEACGISGIKAVTKVALESGFDTALLDYRTSADASNDTSRVVGYMSGVVW